MKIDVGYLSHRGHFRFGKPGVLRRDRAIYSCESGFTLFELMVTVAVSAILLGIALPNYRNMIMTNRLTTATNDFVAAVSVARLEAVRRSTSIQICAGGTINNGTDGLGLACATTTCGTTASASVPGTVCMVQADGTTPVKLYTAPKMPTGISTNSTTALRFGGQGLARKVGDTSPTYTGLLIDVWTDKLTTNNHRCVYITTGSAISTCSYTSINVCPANEDPTTCK